MRSRWTLLVVLAALPPLALITWAIWKTPLPLSETIALLEDVARKPPVLFFVPDTPYYRPLFHVTLGAIWNSTLALETRLHAIHLLQIVPLVALVAAFIAGIRPRRPLEALAAMAALAVLLGSPGMRDNLELPLSYTTVGMPLGLLIWWLLNAERSRWWHSAAILGCTLVAIGFKEQGLAVVALVAAAAATRAPGATLRLCVAVAAIAGGYVAARLLWHARLPVFEQAVGLGFHEIEPSNAIAKYGRFPYFVYAYSSLATIGNVLFSEPTRGVFSITWTIGHGVADTWEYINLCSSLALTSLIGWWGLRTAVAAARTGAWSVESRTAVALALILLACGALSFNYSRDRLGGMAVPFYALAAYFAIVQAAQRARELSMTGGRLVAAGLLVLGGLWGLRTIGTLEAVRVTSARNQLEWITQGLPRRLEFAERPVYLAIMQDLRPQGTAPGAPWPARYPGALATVFGPQPAALAPPRSTLAEAIAQHDVARAFALVRAGQLPNYPIIVNDAALTGGRDQPVSPLWWAVAQRDDNSVLMLLDAGARIERTERPRADCLAEARGERAILALLRRYGSPPPDACAP